MGFESDQAVYKWQRGESLPTVDNLFALSRLFGTSVDDILIGCEDGEEKSSPVHFRRFYFRIYFGSEIVPQNGPIENQVLCLLRYPNRLSPCHLYEHF